MPLPTVEEHATATLFRPQRGGLKESMQDARRFDGTWEGLAIAVGDMWVLDAVRHYGYDDRIEWNNYIVTAALKDHPDIINVIGFTNGPVRKP